jgi:hypothetical protein
MNVGGGGGGGGEKFKIKEAKKRRAPFQPKLRNPINGKDRCSFFKKANLKVFGEIIIMGKRKRTTKRLSNCQNFGP